MSNNNLYTSAKRLENINFSPVRKVLNRGRELEAAGQQVIHLEIGEPDFDTPQPIVDATVHALEIEKLTHYGSNNGLKHLRENIANNMVKAKGVAVNPDQVLITLGAAEAIFLSIVALINPGDEVIIFSPAFMNYVNCVQIAGGVPVIIPLREDNEFQIDPSELEKAISAKTRMVIINNPHNPTGAVYEKSILEKLAQISVEQNLLVVSDEIYDSIIYPGTFHYAMASFPGLRERTITINGFSKTYAMTGWRLGYLVAEEQLMPSFLKLHQYVATCAPTFIQAGAANGMLASEQIIKDMVSIFKKRRDILIESLNSINGLSCVNPQGAFYALVNVKALGIKEVVFAEKLLEEKGVAVVPATGFGQSGEGYIRISYATSEVNIQAGLAKIREFVKELS